MTVSVDKFKKDTLFSDNVIHSYTREEAIEDGVLVDVTDIAREAGFVLPVALTRAVWEECKDTFGMS